MFANCFLMNSLMSKRAAPLQASLFLMLATRCLWSAEWVLVDEAGARANIIVPADASPELDWIALDLRGILKKVTGHMQKISAWAPSETITRTNCSGV